MRDAADPAAEGTYDLVTALEMVHDLSRPVEVLRAAKAMLKPGGSVLIMDERVGEEFSTPADPVERFIRQTKSVLIDQSLDHFFGRAVEERLEQMLHGGAPRFLRRCRREVDVTQLLFLVTQMALVLEHAKLRAHSGVGGLTRELGHHVRDRGAAEAMNDVHDLALPPAEGSGRARRFRHA